MYYLAIDIGASSGRHILASVEEGKIILQEIHRFENKLIEKNGHLCWDVKNLFNEILSGLKKCKEMGKIPVSLGIDCFGVDFVLLDQNQNVIGDTIAYRDSRTNGMIEAVSKKIPQDELYSKTGIQSQVYNTIYQLYALKKEDPFALEKAENFLMLPDYFHYLLTGNMQNEYTNATTTQLVNSKTREFDEEILNALGLPQRIFKKLSMPETVIGTLKPEIAQEVGFNLEVILPATHDTGSAIMAVPTEKDCIYLSSGTWSLMGILKNEPDCSLESKNCGFTNEGGYGGNIRYLKNIMGLWIIQSIKRELKENYSFQMLSELAENSSYTHKIDVNDQAFFSPKSMIEAIKTHLKKKGAPDPENIGDLLQSVYHGLAQSYAETVKELETLTGKTYSAVYIIGGGCKDTYLNQLTAEYTNKEIFAGPVEATALGNLIVQMIAKKEFQNILESKKSIVNSFKIEKF